jgi:hypothetical protein
MKPNMLGSWVFGAITLSLLIVLHGWAFRLAGKRRRAGRRTRVHTVDAVTMDGCRISDEPITPT